MFLSIPDTLRRYPTLRASRLYQMARERGYADGYIRGLLWGN
jgi:hypothetical protein